MTIASWRHFVARFALIAAGFVAGAAAASAVEPQVRFETTLGAFTVELNQEKAPLSVANFLKYVEDKHYDGTIFHRVIPGFVAQGGGFTPDMQQKPTRAPIQNEAKNGLSNLAGTIAMARTSDPNSATSQFYINLSDNKNLDYPSFDGWGYAVFGKVVSGMDVVMKMTKVPTGTAANGMGDVPQQPIVIKSARVVAHASE